jgi:hypothetical protein
LTRKTIGDLLDYQRSERTQIAYPSSARRACRDRSMAGLCRATQCHPHSTSRGE